MKRLIVIALALFTILSGEGVLSSLAQSPSADYWPTDEWRTSTPEAQGMDSAKLVEMLNWIKDQGYPIHNLTIIRNGHLVLEVNIHPSPPNARHILYSTAKSVTSVLMGIAMQEGYLESVDQPVLDFFADRMVENVDERKQAMTLEHLLTMMSGFDCSNVTTLEMEKTEDWIQFMLDRSMAMDPGQSFSYCNGCSQLLMAIVGQATGINPGDYARLKLFEPLGITDVVWPTTPQDIPVGFSEIQLTPRDLAKIGYLMLHDGEWDGTQIVSQEWATTSRTHLVDAYTGLGLGYGYQWWTSPGLTHANFFSLGAHGQIMLVFPDLQLIVVYTSAFIDSDYDIPLMLSEMFATPAVVSDEPLPENEEALTELTMLVDELANPEPQSVAIMPEFVKTIDGVTYTLDENELGWESVMLSFGESEAILMVETAGQRIELPVGLDGVYRMSSMTADSVFPLSFLGCIHPRNGTLALSGEVQGTAFQVNTQITGFVEHPVLRFVLWKGDLNVTILREIDAASTRLHGTSQ